MTTETENSEVMLSNEAALERLVGLQDHTTTIVAAYVSNNSVPISDIPALIDSVFTALLTSGNPKADEIEDLPAQKMDKAQVKRSITPDYIVSFLDGKHYKSMKRHLKGHDLTPETYREKFGLPADYPMVCPNYSAARSELAKALGLGQQRRKDPAPEPTPIAEDAPAKPPRRKAAAEAA